MTNSTVAVRFTGDDRDLRRALDNVEQGVGRLHGVIGRVGGALAGAFAVREVGEFVGSLVEAARESERVSNQTAAVIESTGGAAGISAQHVADYAEQLANLTGIDDELIQQGENVLLTFTRVRNEVGEGNNVFDRATGLAADMSAALGTDLQGSIMLVGRALNDPIAGLSLLSRSGVQFTDQQKEWIRTLVESGDVLGAQRVILSELGTQFGGTAEAVATPMDRLKVTLGNIQEEIGARLLPVIDSAAEWLADRLPGAIATASEWFNTTLRPAFEQIAAVVRENWPQIQQTVTDVMTQVQVVIQQVVDAVLVLWQTFGDNILAYVQAVWPYIQQTIEGALNMIRGVIQTVTSLIQGDWGGVWEGIKTTLGGAWDFMIGRVMLAVETVRLVLGAALEVLGNLWSGAWGGIRDVLGGVWDAITRKVTDNVNAVKFVIGAVLGGIGTVWSGIWHPIRDTFIGVWDAIEGAFNRVVDTIRRVWNGLARFWNDHNQVTIPRVHVPGTDIDIGGGTIALGPDLPTLHTGGFVPGRNGADVPIMAQAGELLVSNGETATLVALLREIRDNTRGGSSSPLGAASMRQWLRVA